MGRQATGTVRFRNGRWEAKFTLPTTGKRTPFRPIDPNIKEDDRAAAEACAAEWAPRVAQAAALGGKVELVSEYAGRWLDDREGRGLRSVDDDRSRMRDHVLPILGPFATDTFTADDVERVRDALDEKIRSGALSWKTAACCWTLVTSLCGDMVHAKKREFRCRKDNPAKDVRPPDRGARKGKQYLHPDEFLTFACCPDVPLAWRRAVALAIYTYARDGELRALRWDSGDVDLVHHTVSIAKARSRRTGKMGPTKSAHTRRFAIESALLPLLKVMHAEADGKGAVFPVEELHMTRALRRHLWRAGVRRPELHKDTPTTKGITFHDLRATGLTWAAIRGDDPLKIKQRAGHASFSTTEIYVRTAEAIREGFGVPFPPLPACLLGGQNIVPESSGTLSGGGNSNDSSHLLSGTRVSNPRPSAWEEDAQLRRSLGNSAALAN